MSNSILLKLILSAAKPNTYLKLIGQTYKREMRKEGKKCENNYGTDTNTNAGLRKTSGIRNWVSWREENKTKGKRKPPTHNFCRVRVRFLSI
jgi:hypothetical protein